MSSTTSTQDIYSGTDNNASPEPEKSNDLNRLSREGDQVGAIPVPSGVGVQAPESTPYSTIKDGENSLGDEAYAKAGTERTVPDTGEVSGRKERDDQADEGSLDDYPKGLRLITMTLGIMACVLMVALDNYILGLSLTI